MVADKEVDKVADVVAGLLSFASFEVHMAANNLFLFVLG